MLCCFRARDGVLFFGGVAVIAATTLAFASVLWPVLVTLDLVVVVVVVVVVVDGRCLQVCRRGGCWCRREQRNKKFAWG